MKKGEKIDFQYTGEPQSFTIPVDGIYKLECWGAQGGYGEDYAVSNGGYASGVLELVKGDMLFVYVGESGRYMTYGAGNHSTAVTTLGGWNGGGTVHSSQASHGSGGGATDFRLVGGSWDSSPSLLSRILVAGGGGGTGNWQNSNASGGGESGIGVYAGNQTSGGSSGGSGCTGGTFGIGGDGKGSSGGGSGGGGGWYGGGSGYGGATGNGGGSGYVLTESSYKPEGYTPTQKYWMKETSLIAGNQPIPSTTGTGTQTGNVGNGFARITCIASFGGLNVKCNINGQLKDTESMSVKIDNSWKEVENVFVKIGNEWRLNE